MAKQTSGEWLEVFKSRWNSTYTSENRDRRRMLLFRELVVSFVNGRHPNETKAAARMALEMGDGPDT